MHEGIRLYRLGKFHEALESFRKEKVAEQDYAELSYFLGLCYTKLEQFEEALLYLEQVVTSELGFAQVYQARMVLAYIYALTERHRLAEFELQRLIEDGFDSVQVHAALGYVLYKERKHAAAITQLEKGLELDSSNSTVLNTLAFIMAEENIRPGAALSYVRRALVIKPDYPAYLDTLGWVLFRMGDYKEALENLRRARKSWPDNQEIRQHIRKVMERRDETQK